MVRWPLRKKLFITLGGGAAAIALVMSLLVDLTVVEQIFRYEDRGLEQTRDAFNALQQYRRDQLLERCRLVSELPHFKAAAAVYDPTLPPRDQAEALSTVSDVANRLLAGMDVDLLTLTGVDGVPILAVGSAMRNGVNDLSPIRAIARKAVQGAYSDGFMVLGGEVVYVTSVKVEVGGLQLGTLCLGTSLNAGIANSLENMTGSGVALLGNDRLLAMSEGVPSESAIPLGAVWAGMDASSRRAENRTLVEIGGSRFRTLWIPLRDPHGDVLGAFVVLRSEAQALAFLAGIRQGLLGIALAAVLVALIFSFLFARQITNPVRQLVAFTKRVSRGELEGSIHIGTRDELAVLGDSFNQMTRSLADSRQHLQETNQMLEERRHQLEEANEELRRSKEETEEINKALREAHAKLIQAGKMAVFGELGAGLTHELKQPLSSIRGFAQLVQMKLPEEEAESRRYISMVIQAVDHMNKIVQGLKDFARQSSFEFQEVDVNEVLERTCLLLDAQFKGSEIRLESKLAENVPPILGEANQLQQVFTNLIANARDAMDGMSGGIRVRSRILGEGSYVMVSISDDGPGIPKELLPKIFNSFFTTKPEGKGTGLGLSITQGIVKDHGGRIDVQSRPGKGTTFRLFLPTKLAKNCWETIDCVRDCRPEISGKEECQVYRERRGHRCWDTLRELGRNDPKITQPSCEHCPVYMEKTSFFESASGEHLRPAA